jgi:precorrin-3B synthase
MAVDAENAQVRMGSETWGEVVELAALPEVLVDLATRFVRARGDGVDAAWHVDELNTPLTELHHARDLRTQVTSPFPPRGVLTQDDGRIAEIIDVPDGIVTHEIATAALARAGHDLIVTPWRSLVLPDLESREGLAS